MSVEGFFEFSQGSTYSEDRATALPLVSDNSSLPKTLVHWNALLSNRMSIVPFWRLGRSQMSSGRWEVEEMRLSSKSCVQAGAHLPRLDFSPSWHSLARM